MLLAVISIVSLIALIFRAFRQQHAKIYKDCHDAMRSLMWHKEQKSVCALVLAINVHDARVDPSCGNWAAGVDKMYSSLGMQSPFLGPAGVGAVDPHTFRRNMGDAYKRNWAGLDVSHCTAPSARAKSCTYLRWFARPGKMCPQFGDVRAQYADLFKDARDSMRNLMWHQNQKALSDYVIAILDEPRT